MALVPPGFSQIVHKFEYPGADGEINVIVGAATTAEPTPVEMLAIYDAFASNILPELSSLLTMTGVKVYVGQDGGDPLIFEFEEPSPSAGADTSVVAPISVAYLVRKNSALGGRKNRGRMYLPGVTSGDLNDDGTIATAKQTALQLNVDAWVTALLAISFIDDLVILHTGPEVPTPITSWAVQSKVATQRTRLRG